MRYIIIAAVFVSMFLSSCSSLTPFTQKLYDQNGWSEQDLSQIQFYLSEAITLERAFRQGESRITSGQIVMKNGVEVERITIPRKTPGVLIDIPRENRFIISFEPDNDDASLRFGPSARLGTQYLLGAKDWKNGRGTVIYDNREFTVYSTDGPAKLLVDLRRKKDTNVNQRVARGRKID